jgi:hypothetical protein
LPNAELAATAKPAWLAFLRNRLLETLVMPLSLSN